MPPIPLKVRFPFYANAETDINKMALPNFQPLANTRLAKTFQENSQKKKKRNGANKFKAGGGGGKRGRGLWRERSDTAKQGANTRAAKKKKRKKRRKKEGRRIKCTSDSAVGKAATELRLAEFPARHRKSLRSVVTAAFTMCNIFMAGPPNLMYTQKKKKKENEPDAAALNEIGNSAGGIAL